jgi:hypothetical protein
MAVSTILTAVGTRTSAANDTGVASTGFSNQDVLMLRVFAAETTSGAGSARFTIEDSDDGTNYLTLAVFTLPLNTNGLGPDGKVFELPLRNEAGVMIATASDKVRCALTRITGTGATVTYDFIRQSAV